jgi:hypothetical protein
MVKAENDRQDKGLPRIVNFPAIFGFVIEITELATRRGENGVREGARVGTFARAVAP